MSVQNKYQENLDAGRLGAIADTTAKLLLSRVATVAAIAFGLPVVQSAGDKSAHKAKAGDTAILGVSVRERSTVDDEFAVGDNMRVMTRGAIWVAASVDVSAGDPVTVVVASAEFSNTGGVAMNAVYETSATAGGLAKIRIA